jgi:excisionase family DNA binding protein
MDESTATDLRTVAEAAEHLRVTQRSIYNYISSGALKALRIGPTGDYRIRRHDLDALLVDAQSTT